MYLGRDVARGYPQPKRRGRPCLGSEALRKTKSDNVDDAHSTSKIVSLIIGVPRHVEMALCAFPASMQQFVDFEMIQEPKMKLLGNCNQYASAAELPSEWAKCATS